MISKLKRLVGYFLIPLTKIYIRHFPFRPGKLFLWNNFHWRERMLKTKTNFGISMKVRTGDLVQGNIYYFGVWEPNLTHFIQSRLTNHNSRTFIDVGANVGYFTLLGSQCLSEGKVVSIEAFPSIYDRLLENISLNRLTNIRAINIAATEKKHPVSMYHAGMSNEGATTSIFGKFQSVPIVVDGLPLSDILSDTEISTARLIKIDTEGAEFSVFLGMHSLLEKMPDDVEVVVEISPETLSNDEMHHIFNAFKDAGFFPYVLNNSYDPAYYLFPEKVEYPIKMETYPTTQADIIFSRINDTTLTL